MHEEIKIHWNHIDSTEKVRFLVNTPVSKKEKEYCVCRTGCSKCNYTAPMVACNACDEWCHVDCINFTYGFVHAAPFFVCSNCVDMSFGG